MGLTLKQGYATRNAIFAGFRPHDHHTLHVMHRTAIAVMCDSCSTNFHKTKSSTSNLAWKMGCGHWCCSALLLLDLFPVRGVQYVRLQSMANTVGTVKRMARAAQQLDVADCAAEECQPLPGDLLPRSTSRVLVACRCKPRVGFVPLDCVAQHVNRVVLGFDVSISNRRN